MKLNQLILPNVYLPCLVVIFLLNSCTWAAEPETDRSSPSSQISPTFGKGRVTNRGFFTYGEPLKPQHELLLHDDAELTKIALKAADRSRLPLISLMQDQIRAATASPSPIEMLIKTGRFCNKIIGSDPRSIAIALKTTVPSRLPLISLMQDQIKTASHHAKATHPSEEKENKPESPSGPITIEDIEAMSPDQLAALLVRVEAKQASQRLKNL